MQALHLLEMCMEESMLLAICKYKKDVCFYWVQDEGLKTSCPQAELWGDWSPTADVCPGQGQHREKHSSLEPQAGSRLVQVRRWRGNKTSGPFSFVRWPPHMDSNSSMRCLVLPWRIWRRVLYLSLPALTFSACSMSFWVFLVSSRASANSELRVCRQGGQERPREQATVRNMGSSSSSQQITDVFLGCSNLFKLLEDWVLNPFSWLCCEVVSKCLILNC